MTNGLASAAQTRNATLMAAGPASEAKPSPATALAASARSDEAPPSTPWTTTLSDQRATERLARLIADEVSPGDLITLTGGLGAGKTTFARALIRALAGDPDLEVPSPTFTLLQSYEGPRGAIVHADFYRLGGAPGAVATRWGATTGRAVTLGGMA